MRKKDNVKQSKEMNTKRNEAEAMDGIDLLIMQTLSDELSDITVSEELIAKTLRAAEEQRKAGENRAEREQRDAEEKRGKKRAHVYRIWGGALTAAAALIIVVLGVGAMRLEDRKASNEYTGSMAGGDMMNGTEGLYAEQDGGVESSPMNEPEGISNEEMKGEWEDGFAGQNSYETDQAYPEEIQSSEIRGWSVTESADMTDEAEGGFGAAEPFPEKEVGKEITDNVSGENGAWLYDELLAAFDTAEKATPEFVGELKGETRSISWQSDGATLSCLVYREDYRIEAVLEENGVKRTIVLENWVYARELWELAGERGGE